MAAHELTLSGVPVLMYHGLGASPPADLGPRERTYWLSTEAFGRQLALVRRGSHRVVGLYDSWADETGERRAPAPVVLTFDDGRASDYEVAFPMLLAARVPGAFFINTATIGRPGYLTWAQVVEMHRAGMSFQSHAHDHVVLPALSESALRAQLEISRQQIEDRVGRRVDFVAAPYGLLDRRLVNTAREVGYRAVCGSLGWPARRRRAVVNRVAVYRETTDARFAAILDRRPAAYLPGLARAALRYLPKQVLLRVRPWALGAQLSTEKA
jgi:peptidoglycan/xylan/chitin deacetylase (PgdA/CDA1 family)